MFWHEMGCESNVLAAHFIIMVNIDEVFDSLSGVTPLYLPDTMIPFLFDLPDGESSDTFSYTVARLQDYGFRKVYIQRAGVTGFYVWVKGEVTKEWPRILDWSVVYLLQTIRNSRDIDPTMEDSELIRQAFLCIG